MILYRCLAWSERAAPDSPDGPLWFPRPYQGEGRHDNPGAYGCLYVSEQPLSCIVEQLARFRGQRLTAALLRRRGLPLALAQLELHERYPDSVGLRWWSTFESLWANVTLFDRATSGLRLVSVAALDLAADEIAAAAEFLGLRFA